MVFSQNQYGRKEKLFLLCGRKAVEVLVERSKNMVHKKLPILILTVVFLLSCCMVCSADSTAFTVDNESRSVTLEGRTIQYPGTIVAVSIWYPHEDVSSLKDNIEVRTVNAYTDETVVREDKSYTLTFKLKPDDPSGRYKAYVYIQGSSQPEETYFDYSNITRAKEVTDAAKSGTVEEIKTALSTGINDISVIAGERYGNYEEKRRNYVAEYIASHRLQSDEAVAAREELSQILLTVTDMLDKTEELSQGSREEVKDLITNDYAVFLISEEKIVAFGELSEDKQEQVVVNLTSVAGDFVFPEEVAKAFDDILKKVQMPEEEAKPSRPSGGGGNQGGKSFSASSNVVSQVVTKPEVAGNTFSDLENAAWARNAINILADRNIINGKGDGNFYPFDTIKREELVKILVTGFNLKTVSQVVMRFEDIADDEWYADFVKTAYQNGIVNGVSEKEFGTGMDIKRQDLAVLLYNTIKHRGYTLSAEAEETVFIDIENVSDYAKEAVNALTRAEIINGRSDGTFCPHDTATRAETAQMIYKVLYRFNLL